MNTLDTDQLAGEPGAAAATKTRIQSVARASQLLF